MRVSLLGMCTDMSPSWANISKICGRKKSGLDAVGLLRKLARLSG